MSHGTALCYKEHCLVCMPYQNYIAPDLAKGDMIQSNLIDTITGGTVERIVWVDSGLSFASTWTPEQMVIERADEWDGRVTTVGHVVHETEDRIVLGLSKDGETGMWSGCFLIYKPCIVERTRLG